MKNISIWKDTNINLKYHKLKSEKIVDILIIGGGMAGVSAAYHLNNCNLNVCLVEKNKIGFGVTANSTGKLTYLQDILLKVKDKDLYLKSQIDAINIAKNIIEKEKIECDFTKVKSYLFNTKNNSSEIKDVYNLLLKNNISVKEKNMPIVNTGYSICVNDTYIFNPVKFIYNLLPKINNVSIYEYTKVIDIKYKNDLYICKTENAIIKAKYVIIATHYPYFNIPYFFPIRVKLEKSYLSASKCSLNNISAISYSSPYISFRTYKNYLIYLNGSHVLNKTLDYKNKFNDLISDLNKLNLKPKYLWSNKDIITNDYMPYIGYIKKNIIIATGFNTWGMTNGILSGKIISDLILGRNNKYIKLFNPKRSLNLNVITNITGNISSIIKANSKYNSDIKYSIINSKEVATYIDENGNHTVYTTCPHMGCKLIFNEIEKTWDCPCHGSRFDLDGNSIEGPSNYNINVNDN